MEETELDGSGTNSRWARRGRVRGKGEAASHMVKTLTAWRRYKEASEVRIDGQNQSN